MPVRLLSSSVLRWPNRSEVHDSVVKWAQRLIDSRTDVVRVGYFGSYARNDWGPGSDLDLLVVLSDSSSSPSRRALGTSVLDIPVGVDLLVYTESEFRGLESKNPTFHRHLASEAVWVYQRNF